MSSELTVRTPPDASSCPDDGCQANNTPEYTILRSLLASGERKLDDFLPIDEALRLLAEKLSDEEKQKPPKKQQNFAQQEHLIILYLIKKIFQGEAGISLPQHSRCRASLQYDDSMLFFSLKYDYKRLVEALNSDVNNIHFNTLILGPSNQCFDNNIYNTPNECVYCPDYKKLTDFGTITEINNYYIFKLHPEFRTYSISDDCRADDSSTDVKLITCSCKTLHNYFKVVKRGAHCIVFHADINGYINGVPVDSAFVEYADVFIRRMHNTHGRYIDGLFMLFLMTHGIFSLKQNSPFTKDIVPNFFESYTCSECSLKMAIDFISNLSIERISFQNIYEDFSSKALITYQCHPVKPFFNKNSYELDCDKTKNAWESFAFDGMTSEEVLTKQIMIAWCNGQRYKEIFENFSAQARRNYKDPTTFCEAYLKTRVTKMQKKYPHASLPSAPIKGQKVRSS